MELTNEVLHRYSSAVPEGEDVYWLASGMLQAMEEHGGIGLAAPQVGESVRLITGGHPAQGWSFTLINPEITKTSKQTAPSVEGCLSFPGKQVLVRRHKLITVKGFDLNWEPVKFRSRGLMAYCLQHEIDHLDGKCIA